jgi:hypothetical protein
LVSLLQEKNPEVRSAAVRLLDELGQGGSLAIQATATISPDPQNGHAESNASTATMAKATRPKAARRGSRRS